MSKVLDALTVGAVILAYAVLLYVLVMVNPVAQWLRLP